MSTLVSHADRTDKHATTETSSAHNNAVSLVSYISRHVIGNDVVLSTPFGSRSLLYADYVASGRSLSFIEDYLRTEVLPVYGNTHTHSSYTGIQTSLYREEARQLIGRECGTSKDDVVLFCGNGCTAAFANLVHLLFNTTQQQQPKQRTVVFIGPYHHHSVLLPLRELSGDVTLIIIPEDNVAGGVDMKQLRHELSIHTDYSFKIGVFSAASNVTGILCDSLSVTSLLHEYGVLSVWDYACAAPYISIDMNPLRDPMYSKDAIIFSPHKLLGGVSTPGVLIVKKRLLINPIPSTPGGGTVFFVNQRRHRYLQNFEAREEGGTPNIIGSIRAGMAFQLKGSLPHTWREERLQYYCNMMMQRMRKEQNVVIIGNVSARRLPILSFLIDHPQTHLYLHPSFVSAVLNDLFGIQTRAGCMCAGPYGLDCLNVTEQISQRIEAALILRNDVLKPGFTRLNLHYIMNESEVDFILSAVSFVAQHGWKLLPQYGFYADSGEWKHRRQMTKMKERRWLGSISYQDGHMTYPHSADTQPASAQPHMEMEMDEQQRRQQFADLLIEAERIVSRAVLDSPDLGDDFAAISEEFRDLRWFLLPSEATHCIKYPQSVQPPRACKAINPPFTSTALQTKHSAIDMDRKEPSTDHQIHEWKEKEEEETKAPKEEEEEHKGQTITRVSHSNVIPTSVHCLSSQDSLCSSGTCSLLASLICEQQELKAKRAAANKEKKDKVSISHKDAETICKHCYHAHWSISEQIRCTSCPCISFVPLCPPRSIKKDIFLVNKKLRSLVGRAIAEHQMIRQGDRILVGVSGGKDSLTLFTILRAIQAKSPVKFSLAAVTVDPQTPEYDPSPLKQYFASLNVPYFYESRPILSTARACMNKKVSICAFCARMKRGVLYNCVRREQYNVLALGQHADDLAESLLMSAFHNGVLRTMKGNYTIGNGDIRVIRPLLFVRERMTREYASLCSLPVIHENCPACFEAPKERARIKQVLAAQESVHRNVIGNLLTAMKPLIAIRRAHQGNQQQGNVQDNPWQLEVKDEDDDTSAQQWDQPHTACQTN